MDATFIVESAVVHGSFVDVLTFRRVLQVSQTGESEESTCSVSFVWSVVCVVCTVIPPSFLLPQTLDHGDDERMCTFTRRLI